MRYCKDIGMFSIDRSIPASCVHATEFCRATCYNNKLYVLFKDMKPKDVKNEEAWKVLDGDAIRLELSRKLKRQTKRFRLATRGEPFKDIGDVSKVQRLLVANPDTLFWIPTRAWRSPLLRVMIETEIMLMSNAVVLASMDPSNTSEDWQSLKIAGWSTMFYGSDNLRTTPNGDRMFLCPKTHKGIKGHCATCKAGCFAPRTLNRRVDVHLSQH